MLTSLYLHVQYITLYMYIQPLQFLLSGQQFTMRYAHGNNWFSWEKSTTD